MADPSDPLSSDADSQTTGLLINLAIGIPTTLLCLLFFDPLRRKLPSIFESRRKSSTSSSPLPTPPSPSHRPFAWLLPTLSYPLETLVHTHGEDAALFLRYLRFQTAFFSLLCLPAALLLPLYFTAGNKSLPSDNPLRTIGINRFSLGNIPRNDPFRFWLVLAAEYLIFAFVLQQLLFHFSLYCRDRRRYRASNIPANYAILVQDIPPHARTEPAVRAYWQRVFPNDVIKVFLVLDARRLEKVKDEFWHAVDKREAAELRAYRATRPKKHRFRICCHKNNSPDASDTSTQPEKSARDSTRLASGAGQATEEDVGGKRWLCVPRDAQKAVEYWEGRQRRYHARVMAQQRLKDDAGFPTTHSAIVVFRTRHVASIAAQTNFSRQEHEWRVCRAPEPEAVDWAQMAVSGWTVYLRQAVTALLATGLTVFWIIPVTAIMGLVNLSRLAAIEINGKQPFRFLEDIRDMSKVTTGFIESWLPTVILTIFLAIVPNILEFFVSISRIPSKAKQASMVRDWYFVFVTFSNFLFVAFAGTLLQNLGTIIDRPAETVELLASNIPKQAAFMMNFIMLIALTEAPRELLQIFRVGGRWFKRAFFAKTDRQREEADVGDPEMDYVGFYAISQLIGLLGLVYCTIQPFIIPCCVAYFGISYVVFKYNLCYSLHNEYEDGGRMYGGALYAVWFGLFAHLLTMIGVFGLNKSPAQSALIIIPAVVSVLFVLHCRKSYDRVIEHGSALETQDRVEGLEGPDAECEDLLESYLHPGFEELPEEIENKSGVYRKTTKGNEGDEDLEEEDEVDNDLSEENDMDQTGGGGEEQLEEVTVSG